MEFKLLKEMDLTGRVAVITGGGRGIGREIALAMAECGADIALAARTEEELESVKQEVIEKGKRCIALRTDVSDSKQVDNLVENTISEFGQIDIMVNNAGALHFLPLVPIPDQVPNPARLSRTPDSRISDDEWQKIMDVQNPNLFTQKTRFLLIELRIVKLLVFLQELLLQKFWSKNL